MLKETAAGLLHLHAHRNVCGGGGGGFLCFYVIEEHKVFGLSHEQAPKEKCLSKTLKVPKLSWEQPSLRSDQPSRRGESAEALSATLGDLLRRVDGVGDKSALDALPAVLDLDVPAPHQLKNVPRQVHERLEGKKREGAWMSLKFSASNICNLEL